MCGRYFIATEQDDAEIKKIIEEVNDRFKDTPELSKMKTGEIYPTNIVPIITPVSPVLMKWGFTRFDGKGQVINARLETAAEKPMFRKAFAEHRCLIPASHYFEWETIGKKKQKYAIGLRSTLYMAGIYRFEKDMPIPLFVILTRPAAPVISFIHERMPVIMPKELSGVWLSGEMESHDVMHHSVENVSYVGIDVMPTLF
ncbi:MAG: SOS response-associated peptidase [Desulfitobacterium sp.]